MASRPFFDRSKGHWYIKWKSPTGWAKARLCPHPGWAKGQPVPRRPPADAVRLARVWQDRETNARAESPSAPMTIADFLDSYIAVAGAGKADGTMKLIRRNVRRFLGWCNGLGLTNLDEVTTDVCRRYLADRAKSVGHTTLKTERGVLAPAWSQAFQDGRVTINPWPRAPVPGKARTEHPPYWSPEEIDRLAAVCKPWVRDVVIVGAYSGLRISSLLGLIWDDVDFAKGTIRVRADESKSGRTYEAPMLGPSVDVLKARKRASEGNPLVFPGVQSGRRIRAKLTYEAIGRYVKRAGIPDHGHYNHVTRHSFATMCIHKGIPLSVVSAWLGHSSIAQTMKYVHSDAREMKRWARLFDAGGGDHET